MMRKVIWVILLIFAIMFVSSCGRARKYNLKPDDDFSYSVYERVSNEFHYHGKKETELYGTCYEYQIINKNAESISNFISVISSCMENVNSKVSVYVYSDIPGGLECVFSLKNYAQEGEKKGDLIAGCFLFVSDPGVVSDGIYYDPVTYSGIEGITMISIPSKMDEKAKNVGIDWYANSPDLEQVIVRE